MQNIHTYHLLMSTMVVGNANSSNWYVILCHKSVFELAMQILDQMCATSKIMLKNANNLRLLSCPNTLLLCGGVVLRITPQHIYMGIYNGNGAAA